MEPSALPDYPKSASLAKTFAEEERSSAPLGRGGRGGLLRRHEVDDPVARRTLLEDRLAAQAVKELRGQRHVARLTGPVAGLRERGAALGADHVVASVELRGQRLERDVALGALGGLF